MSITHPEVTLTEKDPDVQPGLTARFQFHQALHDNDLLKAIAALEVLKEIGQPLRDPDLVQHARQMTKQAELATYQAFCEADFDPMCAYLHKRYVALQRLW